MTANEIRARIEASENIIRLEQITIDSGKEMLKKIGEKYTPPTDEAISKRMNFEDLLSQATTEEKIAQTKKLDKICEQYWGPDSKPKTSHITK